MTIALAGNPNSGKTSLFNAMTGGRQHVGNYPGVTVEKKEGICRHGDRELKMVDLPGTYSLTAYSVEEVVARNYVIHENPDVVINVIDASNLERNLYLTVQLRELGVPVVLAFNMSDVAKARGIEFNLELLSSLLGAPIVPTVGSKKTGIGDLLDQAVRVGTGAYRQPPDIDYGKEVEQAIATIAGRLGAYAGIHDAVIARWTAIKLLENDKDVLSQFQNPALDQCVHTEQQRIESILGDSAEMIIADRRYGFISGACQEAVRSTVEARHTHSDRIDEIVIHRVCRQGGLRRAARHRLRRRRGRRGVRTAAGPAQAQLQPADRLLHHALHADLSPLYGHHCRDQAREQLLEMGTLPARRADPAGIRPDADRVPGWGIGCWSLVIGYWSMVVG